MKRWGCFYVEFKNDSGLLSTLFYFLYFARRVSFALSQIYLNSHLFLQAGLNLFGSFSTLTYLIYYRPFKDNSILITNIAGEIAIALVMALSIPFLWKLDSSIQEILETIIIGIILLSMLIQVAISMTSACRSIHNLWLKYEKARSRSFLKAFSINNNGIKTPNI